MLVIDKDILFDGPTGCFSNSPEGLSLALTQSVDFDVWPLGMSVDEVRNTSASFCLSIFDACNLDCAYCFNKNKKGKPIDLNLAFSFLEECFRLYPNKDKYHVDLSGKGGTVAVFEGYLSHQGILPEEAGGASERGLGPIRLQRDAAQPRNSQSSATERHLVRRFD